MQKMDPTLPGTVIKWTVPDIQFFPRLSLVDFSILYRTPHGEGEHRTGQTDIGGKS